MNRDDLLYDLTLAMLRLTSWEEQGLDGPVLRAWKSYDWSTTDRLVDDGLVTAMPRAKSAYLTDEGRARAEEVVRLLERALEDDLGGESQDPDSAIDAALPQGRGIKVFKFRVELRLWSEHPCWREILVPASGAFIDLHQAIQGAFLWWDYHLMHFDVVVRGRTVEITYEDMIREREDFAVVGEVLPEMRAAETLSLSDIFPRCRTAVYEYDYGDGWEHDVTFVEVIRDYRGELPVCTAGEGDAPPEDVGGPGGFEKFLRAIADPDDPEHEFLQGWGWGQFFEPFSLDAVNRRMRAWRTGELLEEWNERHGY